MTSAVNQLQYKFCEYQPWLDKTAIDEYLQ